MTPKRNVRLDRLGEVFGLSNQVVQYWLRNGYIPGKRGFRGKGGASLLSEDEAIVAARAMALRGERRRFQFIASLRLQVGGEEIDLGPAVMRHNRAIVLSQPLDPMTENLVRRGVDEAIQASKEAA